MTDHTTDLYYSWELLDAEGEWQAGGQAGALDDVRREGTRCLMQYSQDGPHKLFITEHITRTVEEYN
jgi:hypothetical protein